MKVKTVVLHHNNIVKFSIFFRNFKIFCSYGRDNTTLLDRVPVPCSSPVPPDVQCHEESKPGSHGQLGLPLWPVGLPAGHAVVV